MHACNTTDNLTTLWPFLHRQVHEKVDLPFIECHVDAPLNVCESELLWQKLVITDQCLSDYKATISTEIMLLQSCISTVRLNGSILFR